MLSGTYFYFIDENCESQRHYGDILSHGHTISASGYGLFGSRPVALLLKYMNSVYLKFTLLIFKLGVLELLEVNFHLL